jgi:hypothetical protein
LESQERRRCVGVGAGELHKDDAVKNDVSSVLSTTSLILVSLSPAVHDGIFYDFLFSGPSNHSCQGIVRLQEIILSRLDNDWKKRLKVSLPLSLSDTESFNSAPLRCEQRTM